MTKQSFRIESGQEYSLSQIFNGQYKIVIPDLQRDYCWGDKAWNKNTDNYKELVSGFMKSLIAAFDEKDKEELTLGLIYGYENPYNTIQLCDGQQRLTTLFLLIGLLYRRTKKEELKHLLMTEFELGDDKEPNLQYAIRESTLYFLSDLVFDFFIEGKGDIDSLDKSSWYFIEYNLDASIQSMLKSLKIIDSILTNDIDINELELFADFIINNLSILYYDMGDRTRGEETFVVINTTGEPLTATENLKPILLGNIKDETKREYFSKQWEDREKWFWNERNKDETTSDEALNDFFVWYWQIRLLQEKAWRNKRSYSLNPIELFQKRPVVDVNEEEQPELDKWEKSINLDTVHKYFKALKRIVQFSKYEENSKILQSIHMSSEISLSWFRRNKEQLDIILPLLAYAVKFESLENFHLFLRRIRKNYFDNYWKERSANYVDWRHIIQIIELSETEEDVLKFKTKNAEDKFKKIANVKLNEWYGKQEEKKFSLSAHQAEIQNWEDHPDFMGDISFLLASHKYTEEEFSFNTMNDCFNNYTEIIDSIRKEVDDSKTNIYRLFLLYAGVEKVEHKPRVSWEIEGILFSTIYRNHLNIKDLHILCSLPENELIPYCLKFIGNKIKEQDILNLDASNFTAEKALKFWLTLKGFYANKLNKRLYFFDGNNGEEGVSVYLDANMNKLVDSEEFSYYNMIIGFAIKTSRYPSEIRYAAKDSAWENPLLIDAPFSNFAYNKDERTLEDLAEHKRTIDNLIESIKKQLIT